MSEASGASIVVTPLSALDEVARRVRPRSVVTLMSSADPVPLPPGIEAVRHMHLAFNDIVAPREGLVPPGEEHVSRIIAHAREWNGQAPLLIHCWFGVSRSPAAAAIAVAARRPERSGASIATALRRAAPFATPNRLMVEIADRLLDRGGELVAAIDAIGRGAEVSEGLPFTLALDPPEA